METTVSTPKTVLLIFDDITQSLLFRYILQARMSLNILEAADVNTAQKIISDSRPDLIMLDDWIGETRGVEFTRLLRAQPELKMIPLIMYIIGNQEKVDEAKNAGADIVITMPFDPQELIRVVQSLIRV